MSEEEASQARQSVVGGRWYLSVRALVLAGPTTDRMASSLMPDEHHQHHTDDDDDDDDEHSLPAPPRLPPSLPGWLGGGW